ARASGGGRRDDGGRLLVAGVPAGVRLGAGVRAGVRIEDRPFAHAARAEREGQGREGEGAERREVHRPILRESGTPGAKGRPAPSRVEGEYGEGAGGVMGWMRDARWRTGDKGGNEARDRLT